MLKRPVVTIFYPTYLPGFLAGGPVTSISNLVDRLGDDFDFRIITLNVDKNSSVVYDGILSDRWYRVGKANVWYLDARRSLIYQIIANRLCSSSDVLYLNSFFDSLFTLKIIFGVKLRMIATRGVVLAPRGEFSPGALSLKSIKKQCYIFFFKILNLSSVLSWHFSSAIELGDFRRIFSDIPEQKIFVAMNLTPGLSGTELKVRSFSGINNVNMCFLGRISRMKNLLFAIRVLALVKSSVNFTIYGPIEDQEYYSECCNELLKLGSNVSYAFAGEVSPDHVSHSLSAHELFFLPTCGENYGHVIFEALSAGLPVLISDRTPWGCVVDESVGWVNSLDSPELFSAAIDYYASLDSDQRHDYAKRANSYACRRVNSDVSPGVTSAMFMSFVSS